MTINFYNKEDKYFELSNFYNSEFTIDDITYINVEQFFQSEKFNDKSNELMLEYKNLICNADSPQKVKNLGSQTTNYRGGKWLINKKKPELGLLNDNIKKYKDLIKIREDWNDIRDDIMYKGIFAKFTQNKDLKKLLLMTGNKILIEDSPRDWYWGIGKDRTGKNKLGELLMRLREELRD